QPGRFERRVALWAGEPVDLLADAGTRRRQSDIASLGTKHGLGRDPYGRAFPFDHARSPGQPGAEPDKHQMVAGFQTARGQRVLERQRDRGDRKSTRLNSSHRTISYAVFCLKKKKKKKTKNIINKKNKKIKTKQVKIHNTSTKH